MLSEVTGFFFPSFFFFFPPLTAGRTPHRKQRAKIKPFKELFRHKTILRTKRAGKSAYGVENGSHGRKWTADDFGGGKGGGAAQLGG
jgi:hypothetical protein